MVFAADEFYPLALAATEDAPPVLSILGNKRLLNLPTIGIVGARNASLNGRKFAEKIGKAGFKVEEVQVYAHGNKGTKHTLWIGSKLKA